MRLPNNSCINQRQNTSSMEKKPTVSIIVPVYNVEKYLEECVESVLSQTFTDFELLLIDDGSTDSSGDLCDQIAKRDVRVRVIHKSNRGSSSARNKGMDEAKGEWIMFLDSDDKWAGKDGLRRLCDYAMRKNLDVLRFEYQSMNDDMTVRLPQKVTDKQMCCNKVLSNFELVKYGIAGEWFSVLFLLRRELVGALRQNTNLSFLEDMDFLCRLFVAHECSCGYIADDFYLYRKRGGSLSSSPRVDQLKCSFGMCDVFWNQSRQLEDKKMQQLYVHYSVMMYYWTLQTVASDVYYRNRARIIEELNLVQMHKNTLVRMKKGTVKPIYWPFVMPTPKIGVVLLHLKDKLRVALK